MKKGEGMESRSIVTVAVLVVAAIALASALQLLGVNRELPGTTASTPRNGVIAEGGTAESIIDLSIRTVEEIILRDGDEVIRFIPDDRSKGTWLMAEPELSGVENRAVSAWANRFLTISGVRMVAASDSPAPFSEREGLSEDVVIIDSALYRNISDDLATSRFQLTWQLSDGTRQTISLNQIPTAQTACYAAVEGRDGLWRVNHIFRDLARNPLDQLARPIVSLPVYAVTDFQLFRAADQLTLEAKRIAPRDLQQQEGGVAQPSDGSEASTESEVPTATLPLSTTTIESKINYLILGMEDQPGSWVLIRPILVDANHYTLFSLLLELTSLEAHTFVEAAPQSLELYGLDEPRYAFKLTGMDADGEVHEEEIFFGDDASADSCFAWSSRLNVVFTYKKESVQLIDTRLIDLISRKPFQIALSDVSQVIIDLPVGQSEMQVRVQDSPDAEGDHPKTGYYFNGQDADIQDKNGYHYFKQLYRSINNIEAAGVDTVLPAELHPRHSFTIIYHDRIEDKEKASTVSLMSRDEDTYYMFVNEVYSGLYCSRDVLLRDDPYNYGILIALQKMEDGLSTEDEVQETEIPST